MRYRRFALENEMPEADAEPIVAFYSEKAYPGLQKYWGHTRDELKNNGRCLFNCMGRKVRLLGEAGVELWMAAYSFKPQSTVFDVCRTGMIRAYRDESIEFEDMHLGAQVHDSLMSNYPTPGTTDEWYSLARFLDRMVNSHMRVGLRYTGAVDAVEREFTLGVDAKIGHDWGTMHSIKVTQDLDSLVDQVKEALNFSADPSVAEAEPEWSAIPGFLDQEQPSVFLDQETAE
jgi:DNA polymerase I-like protein with 3'-5' exonuclease and polymerase domains